MEKRDRFLASLVGVLTAICAAIFKLDYSNIAEGGLTLSSIVLAVYIAAIIGLINSDLAKKMQKTLAPHRKDKTQLGVLTHYFKIASFWSIGTIILSSLTLLIPQPTHGVFIVLWSLLSILGLIFYVENLVFLVIIMRFMLNRQIWNS